MLNGIDRKWEGEDNGVWKAPGEEILFEWKKPVTVSGARLIFDSDMKPYGKRMRKLEATTERRNMPKMLTKGFRIDVLDGKQWRSVFEETDNILRYRKVNFTPVKTKAVRLVILSTWGAEQAHVFAFDVL